MKNYPIWKSLTVLSLVLLGIIFAIPSIIYDENSENWFLKNKINLGLDLQGGSYLLLEVQLDVLYCLLYTSPSPRDATLSRMPSSA